MCEKEFSSSVGCVRLRSDCGGKYLFGLFNLYLTNRGIQRQLTVANTPHQNGVAERKNQTLLETARNIFISGQFPPHLWQEAVRAANYVRNQCGTRSLNLSSPFEALTGKKPDISHFRILGSTAYILVPKDTRGGKLQPTNYRGVLLGYDDESKAYRLYNPATQQVVISHQVHVIEGQLGNFGSPSSDFQDVFAPLFDTSTGDLVAPRVPDADLPVLAPVPPKLPHHYDLADPDDHLPIQPAADQLPPVCRYPRRDRRPPTRDQDYVRTDDYSFIVQTNEPVSDDISTSQALSHPGWKAAMQEELDSLISTGTWELGPLPPGHHALSSKWIFKTKPEINATQFRLKARLVARGFEQQAGIDFHETFAPVVKWSTLRSVIALSVALGWDLQHMDIVCFPIQFT